MCRVGASLHIKWHEINRVNRWLMLRTRKTHSGGEKSWKVSINSELLKVLKGLKQGPPSEVVFPTIKGKIRQQYPRYLSALCKNANVKPFTFHSIRHYAVTLAGDKNARPCKRSKPFSDTRGPARLASIFSLWTKGYAIQPKC